MILPFPFTLNYSSGNDGKCKWIISWPSISDIRSFTMKNKLLDVIFKETKTMEVGLGLNCYPDEQRIMWIDSMAWMSDKSGDYSDYLQDRYDIETIILKDKENADKLMVWFEKRYIWATLRE